MAMPAALETRPSRSPSRWPPSAEPQGIELSPVAVIVVTLGLLAFGYFIAWSAPTDRGPAPYLRWLLMTSIVELIVWVGVVVGLGWRRAAGLVTGSLSWWGIAPLVAISTASLLMAGRAEEASVGAGLQLVIAIGVLIEALGEEVAFRGFLYHGLTRRFGGTVAMASCSLLFALYHLPVLVGNEVRGVYMIISLLTHFTFGMFMCRIRAETGSIWFPTAVHALWNLTAVDIAIWAFPEGLHPDAFGWIRLAIDGTGLILAYGLLWRALLAHSARSLVSGPPIDDGKRASAATAFDWRAFYGNLARSPSRDVFDRFTERARSAVVLAQEEARSAQARAVGTEHVLLALIHESDAVASEALQACGISPGSPTRLSELIRDRSELAPTLPFDVRARMVLRLAALEADEWKHVHIGTEHLLMGLTALRRSEAARLLRMRGFHRADLRRTTLRLLVERSWTTEHASVVRGGSTDAPNDGAETIQSNPADATDPPPAPAAANPIEGYRGERHDHVAPPS
jgi:membrane protease YdiL (CAAX protease family)